MTAQLGICGKRWTGRARATRNTLTPLRSVLEDALNDGLLPFNPFEHIALAKLIRQIAKASGYVVNTFTAAERSQLLGACRADELPTLRVWFETACALASFRR